MKVTLDQSLREKNSLLWCYSDTLRLFFFLDEEAKEARRKWGVTVHFIFFTTLKVYGHEGANLKFVCLKNKRLTKQIL